MGGVAWPSVAQRLQGLDADNDGKTSKKALPRNNGASNPTTLGIVSPDDSASSTLHDNAKTKESEEVRSIEGLFGRAEELEKQPTREYYDIDVPLGKDVGAPTQDQTDRQVAAHKPYKKWCKQGSQGLAMRPTQKQ